MEKQTPDLARQLVNKLVTSDNSKEIVDALKDALYTKAMERLEQKKKEKASDMLFGKKRDEMEYVDAKLPKGAADKRAEFDNDTLLKTGENAAGSVEPDAYVGPTPERGAMGWMNPKGVPQRQYSGDRRKGVSGGCGMW